MGIIAGSGHNFWSCFQNSCNSFYLHYMGSMMPKTISRYCPFKSIFLCQMILKTKLDDIKKAVVVGGPIPQVFKTLSLYVRKKLY
jgi:hypothetical protein